MVTNPSDPNSAKAGGMQSMLARLKGMVQNLQSGAAPEEEAVSDDDLPATIPMTKPASPVNQTPPVADAVIAAPTAPEAVPVLTALPVEASPELGDVDI